MRRKVVIGGSTGSIGRQGIEVALACPERFEVTAIAANSSVDTLIEQARTLHPRVVAIADDSKVEQLRSSIDSSIEVRSGADSLVSIVEEGDTVLNAIVGFAGLQTTLATLRAGKRLALANKESLVAGGPLVSAVRNTPGAELLPVDSEHGALHQCLRSGDLREVASMTLTASGGPFRGRSLADLQTVTVEDALAHPTWKMGPKITIDSSTLFNKGLEVIEAAELFGIDYDRIKVVVHPQSIIHSSVDFVDGSSIAQLSRPDMRLPIGYALGFPERLEVPFGGLDWGRLGSLDFEAPDLQTFRCLALAFQAGRAGNGAPAVLNAANEVAVEAFLDKRVTWVEIPGIIEEALSVCSDEAISDISQLVDLDSQARRVARDRVSQRT